MLEEEAEASSINGYIKIINREITKQKKQNNISLPIFRGQSGDWPLLPKLARLANAGRLNEKIRAAEKTILENFHLRSTAFVKNRLQDEWDRMALAQHHGLPTRLLDWSESALTALWFAVNDLSPKNDNGVVWILSPRSDDFVKGGFSPLENRITMLFRPYYVSPRISAQSGLFSVHQLEDNSETKGLERHNKYRKKLTKIIIPSSSYSNMQKELNMLGVNHSSIYPDLDGLCKHIEWESYSK